MTDSAPTSDLLARMEEARIEHEGVPTLAGSVQTIWDLLGDLAAALRAAEAERAEIRSRVAALVEELPGHIQEGYGWHINRVGELLWPSAAVASPSEATHADGSPKPNDCACDECMNVELTR